MFALIYHSIGTINQILLVWSWLYFSTSCSKFQRKSFGSLIKRLLPGGQHAFLFSVFSFFTWFHTHCVSSIPNMIVCRFFPTGNVAGQPELVLHLLSNASGQVGSSGICNFRSSKQFSYQFKILPCLCFWYEMFSDQARKKWCFQFWKYYLVCRRKIRSKLRRHSTFLQIKEIIYVYPIFLCPTDFVWFRIHSSLPFFVDLQMHHIFLRFFATDLVSQRIRRHSQCRRLFVVFINKKRFFTAFS